MFNLINKWRGSVNGLNKIFLRKIQSFLRYKKWAYTLENIIDKKYLGRKVDLISFHLR